MTLEVRNVADTFLIFVDTPETIKAFRELVQRGANLWPDAPAEIKEFADLVTSGQILQDYQVQQNFRSRK